MTFFSIQCKHFTVLTTLRKKSCSVLGKKHFEYARNIMSEALEKWAEFYIIVIMILSLLIENRAVGPFLSESKIILSVPLS